MSILAEGYDVTVVHKVVTCLILSLSALAQTPNRAPLTPNAFDPLPLGAVKPAGWLLGQLKIQRAGLTGHIDEFWPDLSSNSAWLGGKGEGWERGPYYLDGLVPLAYLLNDVELIAKARKWVNWTLEHQREDGSIGPEKNQDWWPDMIMLKVLTQYQEATNDPRVIPVLREVLRLPGPLAGAESAQEMGGLSLGRRALQYRLALQSRRRPEAARPGPRHCRTGLQLEAAIRHVRVH